MTKKILIIGGDSQIARDFVVRYSDHYEITTSTRREDSINKSNVYFNLSDLNSIRNITSIKEEWDAVIYFPVIVKHRAFDEITRKEIKASLDNNLLMPLMLIKSLLSKITPHGTFVFISSNLAISPTHNSTLYSLSKIGRETSMKSLATNYEDYKIRFNSLALGFVNTTLSEELKSQHLADVPLCRYAEVSEVSKTLDFMIKCTYLNGSTLVLDGGQSAGTIEK